MWSHCRLTVNVTGDIWNSTLGYEGEGPQRKQRGSRGGGRPMGPRSRVQSNRGRGGPHQRAAPAPEPVPEPAPQRRPPLDEEMPDSEFEGLNPATAPPHIFSREMLAVSATACKRIIAELKLQRRQNRTLRRKLRRRGQESECDAPPKPAAPKASTARKHRRLPTASNITDKAVYNRVMRMANHFKNQLDRLPTDVEKASVVDELLELQDEGFRAELRKLGVVARERFLAVRESIAFLKKEYWNAENLLELRILKYVPMSVFRMGHRLLSKKQDESGLWHPAILLEIPGKISRARKDGIFHHLHVPSPFRNPGELKAAQDKIMKPYDKFQTVSADGKGVQYDALEMGAEAMRKAR